MQLSFFIITHIKTIEGCCVDIVRLEPNKKTKDLWAKANFLIMQLIKEYLQGSSTDVSFGDAFLGLL
jgi:hypothetical protein